MTAIPDNVNKSIYGRMWDSYIDTWTQLQQEGSPGSGYEWPGDEWGHAGLWNDWYQTLFVPNDVANWERAIEIGPGSGKYTLRVLNDSAGQIRGYDVSARFMEICRRRCGEWIDTGRLSLHLLQSAQASEMLADLDAVGWRRTVDAPFSIDSMVHVDLQYLIVYLLTAGLTLKPGGKVILSLADATAEAGFRYMMENVIWTYPIQGQPSGKFEWLSPDLIQSVLHRLGFVVDFMSHTPRDLLLVASLANPASSDRLERYLYPR